MSEIKHILNGPMDEESRLHNHEILLSFNDDIGAEAFYHWWLSEGRHYLVQWAENDEFFSNAITYDD